MKNLATLQSPPTKGDQPAITGVIRYVGKPPRFPQLHGPVVAGSGAAARACRNAVGHAAAEVHDPESAN
jgi:hypothetical protein